ncbi:YiiD C-terminal domain-containing protein [Celerinatantimonas sp. YJH-8]|uniref:bifunctional GNAT family N-acetyltransferase/hotdog fold thioesterase n=1 Tax=Celerinatantimonas sp. YJH-8 TaxID=3228714 RepID=UPI0038C85B0E
MGFQIVIPESEEQLERYFQFRYEMINKLLHLPAGSERDAYDAYSMHRMVVSDEDQIVAVGRIFISDKEALIRHIAVSPGHRQQGLGLMLMRALEQAALDEGVQRIVLTARDQRSLEFFSQAGYNPDGDPHYHKANMFLQQMVKMLDEPCHFVRSPELCEQLYQEIYKRIPLSEKIGIKLTHYDQERLETSLSFGGNTNAYASSMFAGSSYCQAVLTGWSLLWIALQELQMEAEIVLIDGSIRHRRPIHGDCRARAARSQVENIASALTPGHSRSRFKIAVKLYSGERVAAEFEGLFLLRRLSCRPKKVDEC